MTTTYLVQYGRSAFVGRFQSAYPESLPRDARVVVWGPRGPELGTVLCQPAGHFTRPEEADGELIRPVSPEDDDTAARLESLGREILAAADARAEEAVLPMSFVDVEVALDGTSAVLHGLPWGECDASPLFAALSGRFGLTVRLLDLSRTPTASDPPDPAKATCGKPGCGTESGGCSSCGTGSGGGCSTGSCSRGKVKSADELTAYFADLRKKMEAQAAGRTPLG
ncbi:MAG: hypothetical protein JWO38_5738 [Gemmataceae bacterium]|nr:hypothetical protein [Gemmataceae bacterium]